MPVNNNIGKIKFIQKYTLWTGVLTYVLKYGSHFFLTNLWTLKRFIKWQKENKMHDFMNGIH